MSGNILAMSKESAVENPLIQNQQSPINGLNSELSELGIKSDFALRSYQGPTTILSIDKTD